MCVCVCVRVCTGVYRVPGTVYTGTVYTGHPSMYYVYYGIYGYRLSSNISNISSAFCMERRMTDACRGLSVTPRIEGGFVVFDLFPQNPPIHTVPVPEYDQPKNLPV